MSPSCTIISNEDLEEFYREHQSFASGAVQDTEILENIKIFADPERETFVSKAGKELWREFLEEKIYNSIDKTSAARRFRIEGFI